MRALLWASRIVLFLFLFAFAIKNTEPVGVRFLLDTVWQAPLVIVLLVFLSRVPRLRSCRCLVAYLVCVGRSQSSSAN